MEDRFQARGDRRARPPDHPAQDRARGAQEGKRQGLEGPARASWRPSSAELEQKFGRADRRMAGRRRPSWRPIRQKVKERLSSARCDTSWRRGPAPGRPGARRRDRNTVASRPSSAAGERPPRPMAHQEMTRRCSTRRSPKATSPQVVSRWTGIPVDKMLAGERDKLLHHGGAIGAQPRDRPGRGGGRGQQRRPPRPRRVCQDPNRPNGSFLFLGPTGSARPSCARRWRRSCSTTEEA